MTPTIAVLLNLAFAAALVGAWAWLMASARHLREEQAQAHVLDFTVPHEVQGRDERAAAIAA